MQKAHRPKRYAFSASDASFASIEYSISKSETQGQNYTEM